MFVALLSICLINRSTHVLCSVYPHKLGRWKQTLFLFLFSFMTEAPLGTCLSFSHSQTHNFDIKAFHNKIYEIQNIFIDFLGMFCYVKCCLRKLKYFFGLNLLTFFSCMSVFCLYNYQQIFLFVCLYICHSLTICQFFRSYGQFVHYF